MTTENFVEAFAYDSDSGETTALISGNITGPCMDGWAEVNTVVPVVSFDYADCPIDGELEIAGKGGETRTIKFDEDGSVWRVEVRRGCQAVER